MTILLENYKKSAFDLAKELHKFKKNNANKDTITDDEDKDHENKAETPDLIKE